MVERLEFITLFCCLALTQYRCIADRTRLGCRSREIRCREARYVIERNVLTRIDQFRIEVGGECTGCIFNQEGIVFIFIEEAFIYRVKHRICRRSGTSR
ncbi:hypothetical protein D3C72_508590 [compost metagenome]